VEHLQPECLISLPFINHIRKNKALPYLLVTESALFAKAPAFGLVL
jgi:hypothetical protein